MRTTLKKKVVAGAGIAAMAASLAPVIAASPAGAIGVDQGAVTMSVTSGNSATPFALSLPAGAACAEDTANGSWNVTSFMVPSSVDVANLPAFDPGIGPAPTAFGGNYADFRQPLWEPGGNAYVSRVTQNATPPDVTGPILQPTTFDLNPGYAPGDIPAGAYTIGIACVDETQAIQQYWDTTITVSANASDTGTTGISWVQGIDEPPDAPVVQAPGTGASANGDGQIVVDVDPAATGGTPTSYDITVAQGAGTVATRNVVSANPGGEIFTGLANGSYTVTATATNGDGTSSASAPATFIVSSFHNGPIVTASPGSTPGTADVQWTAAGGPVGGYDVTISPAPTTGPATQSVPAGTLSASFSNLDCVVHTVTVTPTGYPAGESAPAASDTVTASCGDGTPATLIQTIEVSREQVNAIVFVQDCDSDLSAGTDGPLPYATDTCIVDLGTATLDATGSYYQAIGELWPIKVIDYRDTDKGWKITGQVDPLFEDSTGTKTFDAEALGWDPKEVFQSAPLVNGYTMTVDEGPVVAPWSGGALKTGSILATTTANGAVQQGIGQAVYSADLTIQIPVSVASGDYSANITFTLVNLT